MRPEPRWRALRSFWTCMCIVLMASLLVQARFSLDELPEDDVDEFLDDPVFGTTKGAPEKGNKQPPAPAKPPKPEPPPKKVKAPSPAPAKNAKASKQKKQEVVEEKAPELPAFSEPSRGTTSNRSFRDSLKALTTTGLGRGPKLSIDWSRTQGLQKAVVPSLLTVTVGAIVSTVWRRYGLGIRTMLGRARASGSNAALTSYVLELESRLMNLQNESEELAVQLTRVQASKTEELTNARSMVEQQKHELEAVKGRNAQLAEEIEGLKSNFQARLELVRTEASNNVEEADKIRGKLEAEFRGKYTSALAKEQEAIRSEVEKELKATFDEQLKQRMVQCEKEIIEFYRQKIDENDAKTHEHYEKKMKAQEEEFRQQLEALRGKFQSLYKEGIESQKEKMLEKVKREYRRRPPEIERPASQSSSSSSSSSPLSRQQSTQERPFNSRRDEEHQHRSALPSRAMEGYNLSAAEAMPARLGL